ncbi:MAG: AAA family ATPase [Caulobacter sp.]|nr:AAA family ATPase [Caulobacter sp.]
MFETPMIARPFCGRTSELAALQAAFDRINVAEARPEMVVILGESGLGKTRLIQQFYNWISTQRDLPGAEGYWPDVLSANDGYAEVNPAEPANGAAPMPFLWLGIRCRDKLTDLRTYVSALEPHLEPLADARERQKLGVEFAEKGLTALVGLIPLIGPLLVAGWGYFKDGRKAYKAFKPRPRREVRIQDAETKRRLGSASELLALFADLLDTPTALANIKARGRQARRLLARMKRIPVVLVVDDAQWADESQALIAFLRDLLAAAGKGGWPLLLLATHWEREWNEAEAAPSPDSFARVAGGWARARDPDWKPMRLRPQEGDVYARIVEGALPGLTAAQRDTLLERAGGNALLLEKIVDHARRNPGLFIDMDPAAALTDEGLKTLATRDFQIHELVAERLQTSPPEIRLAASLSALQGMEYTRRLTLDVADRLGKGDLGSGLDRIENPQALVFPLAPGVYSFAQRAFRDVALRDLPNVADTAAATAAVLASVRAQLADPEGLAALSGAERDELRKVAAPLLAATGEAADVGLASALLLELAAEAADAWDAITTTVYVDRALALEPTISGYRGDDQMDAGGLLARLVDAGRADLARRLADTVGERWVTSGAQARRIARGASLKHLYEALGQSPPDWIDAAVRPEVEGVLSSVSPEARALADARVNALNAAIAEARSRADLGAELDARLEDFRGQTDEVLRLFPAELAAPSRYAPLSALVAEIHWAPEIAAERGLSLGRWTDDVRRQAILELARLLFDLAFRHLDADASPGAKLQAVHVLADVAQRVAEQGDIAALEIPLLRMRKIIVEAAGATRSADMSRAAYRLQTYVMLLNALAGRRAGAFEAATQAGGLLEGALALGASADAWGDLAELRLQLDIFASELQNAPRPPPELIAEALRNSAGAVTGKALSRMTNNALGYCERNDPEAAGIVRAALVDHLQAARTADPGAEAWIKALIETPSSNSDAG